MIPPDNFKTEQIRNLILAGKFVRKTTHGQGYWLRD